VAGRRRKAPPTGPPPAPGGVIGGRWLAGIFLVAMAYRGLCYSAICGQPLLRYPVVDAGYHDAWARRIAAGDLFGHGPDDVFKPPVYPWMLAGLYWLFGRHVAMVQWVQFVLGACSCVLLAVLAGRLLGRWCGRVAGLAAALYAPFVFFELQLLTPAASIFLNTAGLCMLLRGWDGRRTGWLLAAGAVLGLSAGVRPDVILPGFLLVACLIWRDRGVRWRRRAAKAALVAAGGGAIVAGIAMRNYHITGQLIPISSNAGINLYVGNVAGDGTSAVPVGLHWERLICRVPQEVLERPASASRWWAQRTWREARRQPWAVLGRIGRKALAFFSGREFRNNISYHFMQTLAWPLRPPFLQCALILPLAVCGLVCLVRGGGAERRAGLVCTLWVGGYWAAGVVFFVTARFRLPAVPLLILPASWAVVRAVEAVRQRSRTTLLAHAGILLAVGALAWPMWLGRPEDGWVRDYVNLGTSLRTAGDLPGAERAYRDALARRGDDPDANYLLGRLLLPRDPAAGLERLERAREVLPDSPDVLLTLGQGYLSARQPARARKALTELLALAGKCNLWPKRGAWATAHVILAELEASSSQPHWREAWSIDARTAAEAAFLKRRELPRVLETFRAEAGKQPWDWYSQANYGMVLLEMGRAGEAEAPLRAAARLEPQREALRFDLARALLASGREAEARRLLDDLLRELPDCPLRRQVQGLRAQGTNPG